VCRRKYRFEEQRVVCNEAVGICVNIYISALVGCFRKIVTSVHGYEQDRVQPITSHSTVKINFFVLVPYMDTSLSYGINQ
jgi:hypothetical protein